MTKLSSPNPTMSDMWSECMLANSTAEGENGMFLFIVPSPILEHYTPFIPPIVANPAYVFVSCRHGPSLVWVALIDEENVRRTVEFFMVQVEYITGISISFIKHLCVGLDGTLISPKSQARLSDVGIKNGSLVLLL